MQRLLINTFVAIAVLFAIGQALFSATRRPAGSGPDGPKAMALQSARPTAGSFGGEGAVIARDGSGQFHLTAQVNGESAEFLVDTGADVVALTVSEAERLGLAVGPDDFRPVMRTASGTGNGAPVRLDSMVLGDEEFRDVDAVVVEGLGVNLLGQSVLRRLGSVELQGDRMVIRHR